ncbi:hypothetical protein PVL29_000605 [Vitis rotundifolia]|uniref:NADP-dependent oxidoreductase domain-containing protein n=1 Tax=Vitis rotundifolia TaxID=103349 RepID=A0AA39AJI3_VITRO|nr:hypothetical protein PVL29_000605 [Vitis rotundifolia]
MALGSTGKAIPLVGMGTAVYPFAPSETMIDSILIAIELGYRHFDCTAAYLSEKPLGEALYYYRISSILSFSRNLQLDYLDLYLIHWPVSLKPGKYELPVNVDDHLPIDLGSVWKAMEDCQKLGLTKAIGVSNFSCQKLEELLQTASILPAVNQQQKKLRELCAKKGIHITAYSPLGAKGTLWGN